MDPDNTFIGDHSRLGHSGCVNIDKIYNFISRVRILFIYLYLHNHLPTLLRLYSREDDQHKDL